MVRKETFGGVKKSQGRRQKEEEMVSKTQRPQTTELNCGHRQLGFPKKWQAKQTSFVVETGARLHLCVELVCKKLPAYRRSFRSFRNQPEGAMCISAGQA